MRKVLFAIGLALGLTFMSAASADAQVRQGEDLRFVTQTNMPAASGGTYALCHLVTFMDVIFIPVYTYPKAYALSDDGCTGDFYNRISDQQFASLQLTGVVDPGLPAEPALTIKDWIVGHAGPILLAVAGLFRLLAWLIHDRKPRRRKSKGPDKATVAALAAMSQVAVSDGHIDESEITQIAGILTRLTGQGYDRARVRQLLVQMQQHGIDLDGICPSLSPNDRQLVMEAALHVAVADGQMHPNEYELISRIANKLQIDGNTFREALQRIARQMNMNPAPSV